MYLDMIGGLAYFISMSNKQFRFAHRKSKMKITIRFRNGSILRTFSVRSLTSDQVKVVKAYKILFEGGYHAKDIARVISAYYVGATWNIDNIVERLSFHLFKDAISKGLRSEVRDIIAQLQEI